MTRNYPTRLDDKIFSEWLDMIRHSPKRAAQEIGAAAVTLLAESLGHQIGVAGRLLDTQRMISGWKEGKHHD